MSHSKRLLAAMFTLALAAGCGSSKSDSGASNTTAAGQSGTTAAGTPTSKAADNSNVPGITDTKIKLGTTLPITGTAATAGKGLRDGIKLAVDEVNAAGGINGRQIDLTVLDDGFDVNKLVNNVQQLVNEEKVYALVSPAGSQAIPGTYDFIKSSRTPMWGPVSPPDPKIQPVFILGPSRTEQLRVAVDYLATKGVTKLAVIGQNNTLGAEAKAAAEAQAPKDGMTIVARETVEVQSKDVSAAVNNVLATDANGIIMGVDNAQAALVQNQIKGAGKRDKFVIATDAGAGGPGGQNTIKLCEPDACEGFIAGMQTQLTTSDAVATVRDLAAKNNMDAGGLNFIIQTYAYTKAFFEVLKSMNGDFSYDNFYKAAEAINYDSGIVPKIKCGPLPDGHSCGAGAALAEYKGGNWTVVQNFTVAK